MAKPKDPIRTTSARQDLGSIESISYNDAAGAKKVIVIEPVVVRAVAGGERIGAGKYVKITGTSYTLDLVGRAYNSGATYKLGDVVSESTFIYKANVDINTPEAFDATKWRKVADKQVGPVTIVAGSVVNTGRWHNSVTTAGFLVDDDSDAIQNSVRD